MVISHWFVLWTHTLFVCAHDMLWTNIVNGGNTSYCCVFFLLWKHCRFHPPVLVRSKQAVCIICISDEACVLRHDDRGLLTTADTGSQFCITFKPNSHLDRFVSDQFHLNDSVIQYCTK
jgi:hypothetical protein